MSVESLRHRKRSMKSGPLLMLCLMVSGTLWAQPAPKHEFRGVWIATVKNIDWPLSRDGRVERQQQEFREMLALHKANGMNAAIVQVRPAADAFYFSALEPWSEWLNGKQGQAPRPYYDPLAFMVEEVHRAGMEFHAWFNPYRAATDMGPAKYIAPEHVYHRHPEWFVQYGNNLYFDPGVPEARDFVIEVIADVVRRYDIDAVHFDDYFYPYKIAGVAFPDTASFARYRGSFNNLEAWRRNNVNTFIQRVGARIKAEKAWVKFGISPFGVWRNQDKDPKGSATRAGQTSYDDLHADVLTWLAEGWIDYLLPQLYWSIGFPAAGFDVLAAWWNEHARGRHLYIGHGAYKINNNADKNWEDPAETSRQIRMVRSYDKLLGSAFFSAKSFTSSPLSVNDSLRQDMSRSPALIPAMPWIDDTPPAAPRALEASPQARGMVLTWEEPQIDAAGYVVYRFEKKQEVDIENPAHIVAIVRDTRPVFIDSQISQAGKYTYLVTALDRIQNESAASLPVTVKMTRKYLRGR